MCKPVNFYCMHVLYTVDNSKYLAALTGMKHKLSNQKATKSWKGSKNKAKDRTKESTTNDDERNIGKCQLMFGCCYIYAKAGQVIAIHCSHYLQTQTPAMDVKASSLMVRKDSGSVVIAVCDGGTGHVQAEKEGPTRKYTGCALPVHNILTRLLNVSLQIALR